MSLKSAQHICSLSITFIRKSLWKVRVWFLVPRGDRPETIKETAADVLSHAYTLTLLLSYQT